jgi:hypothetical protein
MINKYNTNLCRFNMFFLLSTLQNFAGEYAIPVSVYTRINPVPAMAFAGVR